MRNRTLLTGILVFGSITTAEMPLMAQSLTTLHSFDVTDGSLPDAALVQATTGNLYGITADGGTSDNGTVFKISPSGTFVSLHSFAGYLTEGGMPEASLMQGRDGNFYGTTLYGGANEPGYGTVFKTTPSGALTTLYSFCSQPSCTDGKEPTAGLVQDASGNLYGTTQYGGANLSCYMGCGTVFKITTAGTLTTLYNFCPGGGYCTDGNQPEAALVQATDGNFYGTTYNGGGLCEGTIFKITPSGTLTTLYRFGTQPNCTDGAAPTVGLIQATDGNLYGTTYAGGATGYGTAFKITLGGTLTTLYSFCRDANLCADGAYPFAGLVQGTDGNFYGTTSGGGNGGRTTGSGTIFEITSTGTFNTLYSFCSQSGCPDGGGPYGLVQDTNGEFYGTTGVGGISTPPVGTIFSLNVGLGPFVETEPTSGKVGTAVKILGTNLKGASRVTFNGTAAVFKVASSSLITTSVPRGVTTGTVQVTTPRGTLSSNVVFQVTH
jgi:uncharacterized repeat protein (TIGR03803 family)